MILLVFISSITFIPSLAILEIPPCSPPELTRRYEARLVQQNIVTGQRPHDHQWLRCYLDFCDKYSFAPVDRLSLLAFQEKLQAKHQPEPRCQQARHAVSLYWEIVSPSAAGHIFRRMPPLHRMMQKFQTLTKSKDPRLLSMNNVKGFLSFLAVTKKIAASSQNQAFNALLFLFFRP